MKSSQSPASRFLRLLLLSATLLSFVSAAEAQQPAASPVDTLPPSDTTTISATSALVKSLILPGWGQAYVGAHGRGAFYFALEAGSLWMVYKSSRALDAARELETYLREKDALAPGSRLSIASSRAQQVEDWIALSIFWALFAGADAYVSAQLADFAGHVGALPGPNGDVQFRVRFDVGGSR